MPTGAGSFAKWRRPLALGLMLLLAPAGVSAAGEDSKDGAWPMDGTWTGKAYSSGAGGDCPNFDLTFTVSGHQATGLLRNNEGHSIEMTFPVAADGGFEGTFRSQSNQIVRIDGALKGQTWAGYLIHFTCQGSWYAKRGASRQSTAASSPSTATPSTATPATATPATAATPDIAGQLRQLQALRQQKLIDEDVYKTRRAALLDKLLADSASDSPAAVPPTKQTAAITLGDLEVGRYFALVIANNDYRSLPDLVSAVPDGKAVSRLLRDAYGFDVELLIDATRYDIISALNRYRSVMTARDNLLVYYAGHGILDQDAEQGYWIPVDGDADNPANWIANSDITAAIRAIDANHIMLVVDSCYSGTLSRGIETGLTQDGDDIGWYRRMAAKKARTVLTSGGLEPVTDSGGGDHSVFAKAFLDVLRGNRGIIDGQSVFSGLQRPVVVNARQTPEYSDIAAVGHDGGDFLFVRR